VLGVPPSADAGTVRAAYRRLMKECHPDQNPAADAAERAREVAAAYALLGDRKRRARFDEARLVRPAAVVPPGPRARVRGRWMGVLLVALSLGLVGVAVQRFEVPPVPRLTPDRRVEQVMEAPRLAPPQVPAASEEPVPPPLPVAAPVPQTVMPRPARVTPAAQQVPTAAYLPAATVDECAVEPACAAIDLAALERHLNLLTDQSVLSADANKKARLTATASAFRALMERCASAACRRDAYLARNREIAEIMRG
jgi:hypothetical protein